MPVNHLDLMKRLFVMEFDLTGECNVHELIDDKTHGVQFTDEEMREVCRLRDEAWRDYHLAASSGEEPNEVNADAAMGCISRPDVIGGV